MIKLSPYSTDNPQCTKTDVSIGLRLKLLHFGVELLYFKNKSQSYYITI